MSSIRSASSMTRISIAFRSRPPRSVKSSRRPGVAMTTSAPRAILALLIAERDAADQEREVELVVDAVFAERLLDLGGEFARRLQNERARHAGAGAAALEHRQHRQGEGGGLAGAGLGDAQNVAALQGVGNGLFLDWRRRVVAGRFDGFEHFFAQAEFAKFHHFSLARMPRIRLWSYGGFVDRVNAFAGPARKSSRHASARSARQRLAGAFLRSRRAFT